jgi:DNA-binding MarR family transcriptional regulator
MVSASDAELRSGPTLGYLLWRVTLKWVAAVDRAVAPFRLTHAQYSLLASLYGMSRAGRRPSQRELADYTGLEPMFVSKLARVLERSGLITREVHPADPRAVQLRMTSRGIEVIEPAIAAVRMLQDQQLAPLGGATSRRSAELRRLLEVLLRETHV